MHTCAPMLMLWLASLQALPQATVRENRRSNKRATTDKIKMYLYSACPKPFRPDPTLRTSPNQRALDHAHTHVYKRVSSRCVHTDTGNLKQRHASATGTASNHV